LVQTHCATGSLPVGSGSVSVIWITMRSDRGLAVGLKELTPQERSDALEKAAKARAVRAAAKERLKRGEVSVAELISSGATNDAIARMRVVELLEALPGIGPVRAAGIMAEIGIAGSRRIRGLGIHQARALVDFMDTQQSV
jgi:hypothetical protein